MKLGTVLDVGNDEHGGVTVLKEYKDWLFIWWRPSPWSVFPRNTILLNNDQSSVARAIARDWTSHCASWNPSTAPAVLAVLETGKDCVDTRNHSEVVI